MHQKFEQSRERQGPTPGSIDAAILAYRKSDRFEVLKTTTKVRYGHALEKLSGIIGSFRLASITRRSVVRLQDKIAETQPRNAIEVLKVLNLVFQCAVDLGEVNSNPAKDVQKPARYKAKQHEAWREKQIELFLSNAKPVWRRAVMVALYTSLRRGDLLRLQRSHIKESFIRINIEKTDVETVIPIHSNLATELQRELPAASLMLVPTARGKQMVPSSLTHGIQKEWRRLGVEDGPPLHGLRRSAIIRLLEAGCSVEEVISITRQSERMVKYYAGKRHSEAMAKSAILKLEEHTGNKIV